eukprot:9441714-Pyramimonas_sp.AAC.1
MGPVSLRGEDAARAFNKEFEKCGNRVYLQADKQSLTEALANLFAVCAAAEDAEKVRACFESALAAMEMKADVETTSCMDSLASMLQFALEDSRSMLDVQKEFELLSVAAE